MSLALVAVDAGAVVLLLTGLHAVGIFPGGSAEALPPTYTGLGAALLAAFAAAGLYRRQFVHPVIEMREMAVVTAIVGGVAALVAFLIAQTPEGAIFFGAVGGVGSMALPPIRGLARVLGARCSWWGLPAVIVGSRRQETAIRKTLNTWPEIGLQPVASLTGIPDLDNRVDDQGEVTEVKGWADYLAETVGGNVAVIAMPDLSHANEAVVVDRFSEAFRHVVVASDATDVPALWSTARSGPGLYGRTVQSHQALSVGRLLKRLVDVIGAGALLVACAPLILVIAVLVRWDSDGSVLYTQERMGMNGDPFTAYKFRTMHEDADSVLAEVLDQSPRRRDEYQQFHKLEDDPRITRVGSALRRFSLDELPQLMNVLRGDMSLVGPRPYMLSERSKMEDLDEIILKTRPGLTGLWQVSGRNNLSFSERIDLDIHYIQNWSPWLDVYIAVRTIPTVLTGEGAT